jgi:endoglucanase
MESSKMGLKIFFKTALLALLLVMPLTANAKNKDWPHWQHLKNNYIIDDGRVLDASDPRRITTSEGQSYALFFALIANDKKTFEQLFNWTENNLFKKDITSRLPAWLWGKKNNGEYGILDDNSASDSDLWIAYVLIEAGRLWGNYNYQSLGYFLAERIMNEETVITEDNQRMLLPAAQGFKKDNSTYRLNPSYVPMQLIEYFTHVFTSNEWQQLKQGSLSLIVDSAPEGYSPDWVYYQKGQFFHPRNESNIGSYNAIRTYLWAGMLSPEDENYNKLLEKLSPMQNKIKEIGFPPEIINTQTGKYKGAGPAGFSAAVVPFLSALTDDESAKVQYKRALDLLKPTPGVHYYDYVLTLFGTAWFEGRYRFAKNGSLVTPWQAGE